MSEAVFIPCKYLDYRPENFPSCTLIDLTSEGYLGFKYWIREDPEGNPQAVQFCKNRGRIYNIFNCYGHCDCYCKEVQDV